jgi:hypothetical protein
VDTAAQFAIISESILNFVKHKPWKLKDVKFYTPCEDMPRAGYIVGLVRLRSSSKWYYENIYMALIEQQMLLGFDILYTKSQSILDMGHGVMFLYARKNVEHIMLYPLASVCLSVSNMVSGA